MCDSIVDVLIIAMLSPFAAIGLLVTVIATKHILSEIFGG